MKLPKTIATILLLSSFFFQNSNAQSECPGNAVEHLMANEVKTAIKGNGSFFRGGSGDAGFDVPYSPGQTISNNVYFVNALWMGGIDNGGDLKIAAQTYGSAGGYSDYWPGPIDESSFTVLDNGCDDYDRIWKTTRGDVMQVINDFEDNGIIDESLPHAILAWPAKGNPHFEATMGFPLLDQELAPFFDRNANGKYDPTKGEYPIIGEGFENVVPDEMTWAVFNDLYLQTHGETGSAPIGVEVHFMSYAFNCSEEDILNRTVFTRHKIINRSPDGFDDFRVGLWRDPDLGCFVNDFIGCDTILNTSYEYIGDAVNNVPECEPFLEAYEGSFPVTSTTFLNQDLSSFIFYNNAAFNNPEIATTDPQNPTEYYYYLSGRWKDGSPITIGGYGYDPSSNDVANHLFFDTPNDPSGWAMSTFSPQVHDRRTIMGTGGFDFPPGGQIILDAAYSYNRNPDLLDLGNVDYALSNAAELQSFYDNGMTTGCSQFDLCEEDCVWPGDANQNGIASNIDLLYLGIGMGKNATGAERAFASFVWAPHEADDWSASLPANFNAKNADFSGDGQLDSTDVGVLEINYRKIKPGFVPIDLPAPKGEGGIYIDFDKDEVSAIGSTAERWVKADVIIASDAAPIPYLYGVAFTIKYDPSIWEQYFGAVFSFNQNTFFGDQQDVIEIVHIDVEKGLIEVAISRKDGQAIQNANGVIGRLSFRFKEDAPTGNLNEMQTLSVEIFNAYGVDDQEQLFILNGLADVVIGKDMIYDNTLTDVFDKNHEAASIAVSPNPNSGTFNLFFEKAATASQVDIFDHSGRNVFSEKVPAHAERLDVELGNTLPAGIYFLKWTLADGQFATEKVVVK